MNNKLLPFDLEIALKQPERVVTAKGRKVSEMHRFSTSSGRNLVVIIEGGFYTYFDNGKYWMDASHYDHDLFLLPEKKKIWINVYPCVEGFAGKRAVWHESEEAANTNASDKLIACIKAEIEL